MEPAWNVLHCALHRIPDSVCAYLAVVVKSGSSCSRPFTSKSRGERVLVKLPWQIGSDHPTIFEALSIM